MKEMGIYETMSTLRAVRRHRPDEIPEDVLERVLQAGMWAPSGGNRQPWRIVVVTDKNKKARLKELYSEQWNKYESGYRKNLAGLEGEALAKEERSLAAATWLGDNFDRSPVILIFCFDPRQMAITDMKLDRPSVVGGGSVYPAVQNTLLACRAEGLGCTITTLLCFHEPEVKELLDIPEKWYTCAAIPIGYPMGRGHGPIRRRPIRDMVFRETWGEKYE